jgi:hypothetical protein
MGKQCSRTRDRVCAPPNILLLLFSEMITFLVVETNRYYSQVLGNSDDGPSPQREVTETKMFAFLALTLQMGHAGQSGLKTIGRKWNSLDVHSMDRRWYVQGIITYYVFYISRTISGMELTGRITDYGQCENYLKF